MTHSFFWKDQMLGGSFPTTAPNQATPMPKTMARLVENGTTATNFFIHTPVCCDTRRPNPYPHHGPHCGPNLGPSRAETLTGRYLHNLKRPGKCTMGYDGHDSDGHACCMHVDEELVHDYSFVARLKDAGYTTGMFGKYLNFCPGNCTNECSGKPIPAAFDSWLANGGGDYYQPSFSVKNVDGLEDGTLNTKPKDYTTAVVPHEPSIQSTISFPSY